MNNLNRFYPHLAVFLAFIAISLFYFYPVLQGKKMLQSDIVQYTAMAKEQNDFRAEFKQEPYWTNSAFGGMPTYQLGAQFPHNYIKKLDGFIRFLPRPADYLFLYFICFYVLLMVLKVKPLQAFFGALAFGFSTYLIVIFSAGHNAKAHAIAYMPLVVAGVLLVFKNRLILGGLLTIFAFALEINANHPQMTYYLLFLLLSIGIYFLFENIKAKTIKNLLPQVGVFVLSCLLAIGLNATSLLATKEYANESTRGKSELTFNADGSKKITKEALSYDYITEYSYGVLESFNLISPRIFGGSNSENVGTNSESYQYVLENNVPENEAKEIVKSIPLYWGDQPIVSGPAYIGAIVFFLMVLALFTDKRKIKYVFLSGILLSLFLSWGKNFSVLTNFFIDYVPLYNKFRAVSSIQVVLELCMPVLAVMGLQSFIKLDIESQKWKYLWQTATFCGGLILVLFIAKSSFDFSGESDDYILQNYGPDFMNAIKADRKSMFSADLLRSLFLFVSVFGILWVFIKQRISEKTTVILVGLFMVADLFFIAKNYVNSDNFSSAKEVNEPFVEAPFDTAILEDATHYRVFEVSENAMSNPRPSYFHKSIGGYHAAKPRRMQELFDYHIINNNREVLNMMHVKYLIQRNEKGEQFPVENTQTNGNAWFVEQLQIVTNADAEMKALARVKTKVTALIDKNEITKMPIKTVFQKDTSATIKLISYKPNEIVYQSKNSNNGFAVFSEMYYKNGWNAYIDGKLNQHCRVNYAIRGLQIPAGNHKIEFKFEPKVIKTGSTIALISFLLSILLLFVGIYYLYKNNKSFKWTK